MNEEPLEYKVTMTQEQVDYISKYLGYPIIPTTKDFQMVTSITDQIHSAVQQAKYNDIVKQKAHVKLSKIAKIIIAKEETGRQTFSQQEWDNIFNRVVKEQILDRIYEQKYHMISFRRRHLSPERYLVVQSVPFHMWDVWVVKEGMMLPWLYNERPETFLEIDDEMLEETP